jgi:hypothetical protein
VRVQGAVTGEHLGLEVTRAGRLGRLEAAVDADPPIQPSLVSAVRASTLIGEALQRRLPLAYAASRGDRRAPILVLVFRSERERAIAQRERNRAQPPAEQ